MRTLRQNKFLPVLLLGAALVGGGQTAVAQLSVGPVGLIPQSFDTQPPATNWSQRSTAGAAADVATTAVMDARVQTNIASQINAQLSSVVANPPGALAGGMWSSQGGYIVTRPTGNAFNMIMATLRNNSGSNLSSIRITYNLNLRSTIVEEVLGHSVYFSLTGAAGTWQRLDAISGMTTPGVISTNLTLGSWAINASLYVLFSDDNAGGGTDGTVEIDNFAVTVPFPGITNQPQSSSVAPGQSLTLNVGVVGYAPFTYQWRKDGNPIANATNATLPILNAQVSDNGTYSVVVNNAFGSVVSSNAIVAVICDTPASFTSVPANQSLGLGATLNLVSAATGSSPLSYQWARNGVPIPNATNATYTKVNATLADAGLYSVTLDNCAQLPTTVSAVVAVTDPSYVLVGITSQSWRYDQSGVDRGTAWIATNYNDSAWPLGLGALGLETAAPIAALINTPLALNPGGGQIPTYYFRTTFVLTNDPALISVVSSNYIDDGAVFYVNGQEAFRHNMPVGTINYNTASSANLAEGVFVISNLPSSLLRIGTNHLAVEVHQVNLTSSDVAFGMGLHVNFLAPTLLTITNQPQSLVVEETDTATFTLGVQGQPVNYQWFRNGSPLVGATINPLSIPGLTTNDAGSYYVVASNAINTVISSVVTLGVTADTNGPVLLAADGTILDTQVLASYSELVLPSTATNIGNYKITNTLGGVLTISSAVLQNGTNVLLTTAAPRLINNNYLLIVNNVRDTSPRTNAITANSSQPISSLVNVFALNAFWRYYDPFIGFDAPNLGTTWKEFSYTETNTWADSQAAFYDGSSGVLPAPVNTPIGQTEAITAYFRKGFDLQASPGGLEVRLTHVVDDGAIFYLNGTEVLRHNLPATGVDYLTTASTAVGNIPRLGPLLLNNLALRSGSNVLAVELHQAQAFDTDRAFAAQLDAKVESYTVGPVIITGGPRDVTAFEGQSATFEVSQVGGQRFQWRSNSVAIVGATNATYTIPQVTTNMNNALFTVAVSNATSFALSTNATLRIISDTGAPTIVSAAFQNTTTILVRFSERMNTATAQTPGNYQVTNFAGGVSPVSGAVLTNGTNVLLTFASPLFGQYVVVVNNLKDASIAGNVIAPNSAITVGVDISIPFTSAWKYLLVNTNEEIQTSFDSPGFDDSSWRGPSNALLYVEGDALPVAKNTLLTLFADAPGTAERINTFYFRQAFVSPTGGTNLTMRIRYIIDDGFVLHLNGVEIHRFNMPAGAITAASQAPAGAAEGVIVGPVDVVINLLPGTNILAAEVHQNGATSSDVVFGLEMTGSVPSTGLQSPPPVIITEHPRARTNSVGSTAFFRVSATGTAPLYYQWLKAGVAIPGATNPILTLLNVQNPADAANYSARVTNAFTSALSSNAFLTVTGAVVTCTYIQTTNRLVFSRTGTNLVLSWTNPITNSCGNVGTLTLQGAHYLSNSPATIVWSNITTTTPFNVGIPTNAVPQQTGTRYYRLRF